MAEIVKNLNANNAEHLVIGGFAVNHYNKEREPHDLDIWINPKGDNPGKVVNALHQSRFDGLDVNLASFDLSRGRWATHVTHPETGIRVDVLTNVSGSELFGGFANAHKHAVSQTVDGIEFRFPNAHHLTINKIASWSEDREKDLVDARTVLTYQRELVQQQQMPEVLKQIDERQQELEMEPKSGSQELNIRLEEIRGIVERAGEALGFTHPKQQEPPKPALADRDREPNQFQREVRSLCDQIESGENGREPERPLLSQETGQEQKPDLKQGRGPKLGM